MKHRNKIQILGLGLALALSQASGAFASAGTVTVERRLGRPQHWLKPVRHRPRLDKALPEML